MFSNLLFSILSVIYLILPIKSYSEGMINPPESLNPLKYQGSESEKAIASLLFRNLVRYGKDDEIEPDLSKSWKIDENGKVYTFTLQEGIYWSSGKEFNADDVLYTVANNAQLSQTSVDKLGNYEIRFTLPNPYTPFLDLLTNVYIVPNQVGKEMGGKGLVTLGNFRIIQMKNKNNRLSEITLFTTQPDYDYKKITFKFYGNEKDLITAAKLGEVKAFSYQLSFDYPSFEKITAYPSSRYYGVFFNLRNEHLKDKDFRKSLLSLIDLSEISKGRGELAEGAISKNWATKDLLKVVNLEIERQGYIFTVSLPEGAEHERTFELLKKSWEPLGITLNKEVLSWEQIEDKVISSHNFDIMLLGQQVSRDPDRYSLWHSSQAEYPGLNFTSFSAMRADKALEQGRITLDKAERKRHYNIFQTVFNEEIPAVILYHPIFKYAVNKKIKNLDFSELFSPEERFSQVGDWR